MSEETSLIPTDPVALQEYLRGLVDSTDDALGESALAALNAWALAPEVKMLKPSGQAAKSSSFVLQLSGNPLWDNPRSKIYFVLLDLAGQRALWPSGAMQEGQSRRPVCSVSFADHEQWLRGTTFGTWMDRTEYLPPEAAVRSDGAVSCSKCPWSQFGSMSKWDDSKAGSKAPACGQHRTLVLVLVSPLQKIPVSGEGDYWIFGPAADFREEFALLSLSNATNRKSFDEMILDWRARSGTTGGIKLKLQQAVFEASVGVTGDQYNNAVLKARVAGMVMPAFWQVLRDERAPAVHRFILEARQRGQLYFEQEYPTREAEVPPVLSEEEDQIPF